VDFIVPDYFIGLIVTIASLSPGATGGPGGGGGGGTTAAGGVAGLGAIGLICSLGLAAGFGGTGFFKVTPDNVGGVGGFVPAILAVNVLPLSDLLGCRYSSARVPK